ncbi:MAG: Glu/Leu/Phe/Val dehydrogenase dimerization domain-containing protein, partial [Candidatus Caldarchaeum sp.]
MSSGAVFLSNAIKAFEEAADSLNLDPGIREFLKKPKRIVIVSVPVKMDDGSLKVFSGVRVQHS